MKKNLVKRYICVMLQLCLLLQVPFALAEVELATPFTFKQYTIYVPEGWTSKLSDNGYLYLYGKNGVESGYMAVSNYELSDMTLDNYTDDDIWAFYESIAEGLNASGSIKNAVGEKFPIIGKYGYFTAFDTGNITGYAVFVYNNDAVLCCTASYVSQIEARSIFSNITTADFDAQNTTGMVYNNGLDTSKIKENRTVPQIDYYDDAAFEAALNRGEYLVGRIVRFNILSVHPDSLYGFNLWSGEHLNFISEQPLSVEAGDTLTVKVDAVKKSIGSWIIYFSVIYDSSGSAKPVVFRNIPWGTSASDFLIIINEQGLTGSIKAAPLCSSWEFSKYDGRISSVDYLSNCGYKFSCIPEYFSVAGFKVSSVDAYFLYTHDNEDVYTGKEQSYFYKAEYQFDVVDGKGAYDIIKKKMTALYGEGTVGTNSTGWIFSGGNFHTYCNWTVWYGSNDTGVVMYHVLEKYDENNAIKSDKLYLMYGKTNSLTMLYSLKSAQAREEQEKAMESMDMSGL